MKNATCGSAVRCAPLAVISFSQIGHSSHHIPHTLRPSTKNEHAAIRLGNGFDPSKACPLLFGMAGKPAELRNAVGNEVSVSIDNVRNNCADCIHAEKQEVRSQDQSVPAKSRAMPSESWRVHDGLRCQPLRPSRCTRPPAPSFLARSVRRGTGLRNRKANVLRKAAGRFPRQLQVP